MSDIEAKFNAWRASKTFVAPTSARQSPPFAPGVITHHTSRHRRALLRWLRRAVLLMAFSSTAAFLAGLIHGALQ